MLGFKISNCQQCAHTPLIGPKLHIIYQSDKDECQSCFESYHLSAYPCFVAASISVTAKRLQAWKCYKELLFVLTTMGRCRAGGRVLRDVSGQC